MACIVLAAIMLVSCGGAGKGKKENVHPESIAERDSASRIELSVCWWGNKVRDERTLQALELYSQQNPGVKFSSSYWEWSNYWEELAADAAGHTMPDIVQMDYKYLQEYVEKGLLIDLEPYRKDGTINLAACNQNIIRTARIGEGLYSIAAGINSPALLYNKTLLDKNGIHVKNKMNMDEFLALCKEVYEKTGYKTNINYRNNEQLIEFLLRAEDIVMYEDGKMGGDSAEPYIRYFKLYEDGIREGWHLEPTVFANRTISSVEQDPMVFGTDSAEKSWCAFSYSGMLISMQNAMPLGMEIGTVTWPSNDLQKSSYLKPSLFWGISVDCKNPGEAAKVIDFMTNSVECNKILLAERGVPISEKVADALKPELDANTLKTVEFVTDEVAPVSSMINPLPPNGAREVNELLNQLEEQVCYGELTAEEAGKRLFEEGSRILADQSR